MDGCIAEKRRVEREKWTAIKWAWVDCFGEGEVLKEKEGPCHLLYAERAPEPTSLTKSREGDGDGEIEREVERKEET